MGKLNSYECAFIHPDETRRGGGLTGRLQSLQGKQAILLSRELSPNEITQTVTISDRPDYRNGREDSINGVSFADMSLEGTTSRLATQPIAIKPVDEEWLAARDFRAARAINDIDSGTTFRPLGFLRKPNGDIATITRFEEGVTSFDNLLWKNDYEPTEREIEWSLSCAAATLIFLHANGYKHGDFQVKNTAYDVDLRSRVIDTTTTTKNSNEYVFGEDISLYIESLSRFNKQKSHASKDHVNEWFLGPYYDTIEDILPKSKQQTMREILAVLAVNMDEALAKQEV